MDHEAPLNPMIDDYAERNNENHIGLNVAFVLVVGFIFFVLPKSMTLSFEGSHKDLGEDLLLWRWERACLVAVCALYLLLGFQKLRIPRSAATAIAACSVGVLLNLLVDTWTAAYGLFGSVAALMFVERLRAGRYFPSKFTCKAFAIFCLIYVAQYFVYRLDGRYVSSFLDANISGYYLFLAYLVIRAARMRLLACVALVVGVLSVSRNFIVCLVAFEMVYLLFRSKPQVFSETRAFNLKASIFSIGMVIAISILFPSNPNSLTKNSGGFSRLVNVVDVSNANRFEANISFLTDLSEGKHLIFGAGDSVDDPDINRPHNAFFRAIYRYGFVYSIGLFLVFFRVADYFFVQSSFHKAMIISLYIYYSFLSDFITGPELAVLSITGAVTLALVRAAPTPFGRKMVTARSRSVRQEPFCRTR